VALVSLGAALITLAMYRPALRYYLVNDDFHWLAGARAGAPIPHRPPPGRVPECYP
jgi:hypothetical protein